MEKFFSFIKNLTDSWGPLLGAFGIVCGAVICGLLVQSVLFLLITRIVKKKDDQIGESSFTACCRGPLRLLIPLVFVRFSLPFLPAPQQWLPIFSNTLNLLLIGNGAWLLIRAIDLLEAFILSFYNIGVSDNLEARKIHTQIRFMKRVLVAVILILAVSSMLMLFEKVRQFGVGILTSAGIAGIVIGLAAQRSIANLLVGFQIAATQPIRIDDVVIIENEWGWIEEINSTYAVLRLWDLRRLIVPLTYFTEKTFQNWTRVSANIIGSVYIYVDYSAPVDEIRKELHRILQGSRLWDGKTWVLQVTNAAESSMELRALMSAKNGPEAWDLRCEVREKLIDFLKRNFPSSLPRIRAEVGRRPSSPGAAPDPAENRDE